MRKKTEKVRPYSYKRKGKLVKVGGFKRRPKPKTRKGKHRAFKINYKGGSWQRFHDDQGRLL